MALTFIDTNKLPRVNTPQGAMTQILNEKLAGAKNVVATLRWLTSGETLSTVASDKHQLLYVMEGEASITLEGGADHKEYAVRKGAGVYLGPQETVSITAPFGASVKLLHVAVQA